ncbi:MAG: hypothetical protein JWR75_1872 [Devosia sp.]|nr:hypothetical protein [Devosia sp.]
MSAATLALLFAMLVTGAIPLVLLWIMGRIRLPMVAAKAISIKDIALSRDPWPEHEKRVSNAFDNQFEIPVLFYLVAFMSLYLGVTLLEAGLGFLFAVSRIAHAAIFAINNNVFRRFWAFSTGYVLIVLLFIELFARLFFIALSGT